MNSHARLVESVRRTRNTLYLVVGMYIVVGFVVATATAMQRDRLGTFLGFLIISGALSMGLIARTASQVLVRIAHIEESLDGFAEHLDGLIPLIRSDERVPNTSVPKDETILDLASIGVGDPKQLAAATLDRDVYPRLAVALGQSSAEPARLPEADPDAARALRHGSGNGVNEKSATTRNLLQQWKAALANKDLIQCRQILSVIVDLADSDTVAPLRRQIHELEDRVERNLRDQFTQQIRSRDLVAALETGDQMSMLLSDRPVAAEFERIRPILARRADDVMTVSASTL